MRFLRATLAMSCLAAPAMADLMVPTRTIRAGEIIGPGDVETHPGTRPGAVAAASEVHGLEARVALYPGRAIMRGDVGAPALVERNAHVLLVFEGPRLEITAEGRALARGAEGERIRVMNLESKASLFGVVMPDGRVRVSE